MSNNFEGKQMLDRMHKMIEHDKISDMYCSICDLLLFFDHGCLHFPGNQYLVDDELVMCYLTVKGTLCDNLE